MVSSKKHIGKDGDLLPDEQGATEFYSKYEPKEVLGRGVSSVVRKCIERETGDYYAVKIMDVSDDMIDAEGLNLRQQTRREAAILRKVAGHKNIIELFDVFESKTFIFLVFEFCRNGELFDFLNSKVSLTEKRVRGIMKQICEAVKHCHDLRVMHRDVKPENILLDEDFNVKLTDFGFAKVLEPGEKLFEVCGTPGYLSPELLKSGCLEKDVAPGYGVEIDNWACGVIMYTLLSGSPPFWHRKQLTMIRQIMNAKYTFPSPEWDNITEESKDLVTKFLQEFPDKRITCAEALASHPVFKTVHDNEQIAEKTESNIRPNFNARRMFKVGLLCVKFMIRFRRLKFTPEPLSLAEARINPYAMRMFRKAVDAGAFRVYQHWVKRGEGQNRAAIFEHFPKRELVRLQEKKDSL